MYKETTRSITITVVPTYLDDQSSPEESHYVWKYHVRIENNGDDTVQLRTRYWRITDAVGRVQEVRGPGVVGQTPRLEPGFLLHRSASLPGSIGKCQSAPRHFRLWGEARRIGEKRDCLGGSSFVFRIERVVRLEGIHAFLQQQRRLG